MGDGEVTRRVRGIWFDPEKVRHYAGKVGARSEAQLEILFRGRHAVPETRGVTVVRNAWKGNRPVDKPYARKLAECLGLSDYLPLERTELQSSLWKRFITEKEASKPFMRFKRFIPKGVGESRHFTDPSDERDWENLDRYPLDTHWHLEFDGKRGQDVLACAFGR